MPRRRHPFWISLPFAIVGAALVLFFVYRETTPELTRDSLEAARTRWQKAGLQDYDLTVEVSGAQDGLHEIEVRGGKVTAMRTGGAPAAESAYLYWSVPGMFRFLAIELDNAANPRRAHGTEARVTLRAEFDPKYGFPQRFLRHVSGQNRSVEWNIRAFEKK